MKMTKNVAWVDDLNKQKFPPVLALFTREMTTALEDDCKGLASRISIF